MCIALLKRKGGLADFFCLPTPTQKQRHSLFLLVLSLLAFLVCLLVCNGEIFFVTTFIFHERSTRRTRGREMKEGTKEGTKEDTKESTRENDSAMTDDNLKERFCKWTSLFSLGPLTFTFTTPEALGLTSDVKWPPLAANANEPQSPFLRPEPKIPATTKRREKKEEEDVPYKNPNKRGEIVLRTKEWTNDDISTLRDIVSIFREGVDWKEVAWQMQVTGLRREVADVQSMWEELTGDDVQITAVVSHEEALRKRNKKVPIVNLMSDDDES